MVGISTLNLEVERMSKYVGQFKKSTLEQERALHSGELAIARFVHKH